MVNVGVEFTPDTIEAIFGHEAAENEDPTRLKQYYFKNADYNQIRSQKPLRVLVGHKGIGKSAMFKIAYLEDQEQKKLAIWIRPDDILDVVGDESNLLHAIRDWKSGLYKIIADKAMQSLGLPITEEDKSGAFVNSSGKLLSFIRDIFEPLYKEKINITITNQLVIENYLNSQEINVYIDDLDRGWKGKPSDITRISALLNALRDMATDNPGLRFRVALRTDVYFLVRTSDESTDKIGNSVVWHSWTNHHILALLVKRIETYFSNPMPELALLSLKQADLASYLDRVMEKRFTGQGKWEYAPMYRILMSLTRKRPRDLVKLCTLAANNAHEHGRRRITTQDLQSVFERYSQDRLQDTVNEYRTELPQIEALLLGMKPNKKERVAALGYVYSTERLLQKLRNVSQQHGFQFVNGKATGPRELAQFLYKINFLTARKQLADGHIQRKYFEENQYVNSKFADFGFDWEIHPAYRWALQPEDVDSILFHLELSSDN